MRNYEPDAMKFFEEKALSGDGQFAIAFAVLKLAREHRQLQENLTFGDGSGNRTPGVMEKLAMEVGDIAQLFREDRQA